MLCSLHHSCLPNFAGQSRLLQAAMLWECIALWHYDHRSYWQHMLEPWMWIVERQVRYMYQPGWQLIVCESLGGTLPTSVAAGLPLTSTPHERESA